MKRFIGIDLGTSSMKSILMDENGNIDKSVVKGYPLYFPQTGWSEQNPQDWYDSLEESIKELLDGTDPQDVAGISFGGQMHGLVILDEADNVIRPAILWNDGRSAAETDYLNNDIGKDKLSEYTGNIAFAGFTATKLLWVYNHEPENFKRIKRIMLPKDYLVYRLTGVHSTDVSDASGTLLFDVKNRRWSEQMADICHVRLNQLPRIYESSECVGGLLPGVAERLGLSAAVRVAAGAGDNAAAAVGNGIVGEGRCNISLGTSGTIFISGRNFRVDENNALHAFAHADGHYHLMGCMLSAASCNKWWMDIMGETDYAKMQSAIADGQLGRNEVYFLPYLMGERSPHNNPDARGAFIGMTMNTGKADMLQAVLEGVAFALRDSLEVAKKLGFDIKAASVCGGGARSDLWLKILANVLGIEADIPESDEGPALGAAMLAAVSCGVYRDAEEAAVHIVRKKRTILPDRELTERYERKYRIFRQLYPQLVPVYEVIKHR